MLLQFTFSLQMEDCGAFASLLLEDSSKLHVQRWWEAELNAFKVHHL